MPFEWPPKSNKMVLDLNGKLCIQNYTKDELKIDSYTTSKVVSTQNQK